MARRAGLRIKTLEKLGVLWVTIFTFCVGLALVLPTYPTWINQNLILLLYIFLEFLPLLIFCYTVSQPNLSSYLLLPWILVNICLILFSSILVLSLSISHPSKRNVVLCLVTSVLLIFPTLTALLLSLPALVFIRRRVPNYRSRVRQSRLYRIIFRKKTAEELEQEILARRREQIKNTIITDKSYEQFIYVNRAANKWKRKVEMKRNQEKDILAEGNVTVNVGYGLDTVQEETHLLDNGHHLTDGSHPAANGNRIENGKLVTDV